MHWPVAQRADLSVDLALTENPYPTWQAMEALVAKGKARNIGVSKCVRPCSRVMLTKGSFNARRLANLTANKLAHVPAVNQVELNFWNPQPELVKWAREHNVILEAYSPLGSTRQVGESLKVPEVRLRCWRAWWERLTVAAGEGDRGEALHHPGAGAHLMAGTARRASTAVP